MAESPNPLGGDVWGRGARLGLIWLAVFALVTAVIYALLAVVGWSGTLRVLCAMCAGPVLGTAGIAAWWVIRRPALGPGDGGHDDSFESKP